MAIEVQDEWPSRHCSRGCGRLTAWLEGRHEERARVERHWELSVEAARAQVCLWDRSLGWARLRGTVRSAEPRTQRLPPRGTRSSHTTGVRHPAGAGTHLRVSAESAPATSGTLPLVWDPTLPLVLAVAVSPSHLNILYTLSPGSRYPPRLALSSAINSLPLPTSSQDDPNLWLL